LIAEAEYSLEGETLERRLVEIDHTEETTEKKIALLHLDRKYEKITKEDYDYQLMELKFEGNDRSLARLELDKKYGKISSNAYEKAVYSLKGEPWVGIVGSEFDKKNGPNGLSIEMDWNDAFVQMLKQTGYNGETDEIIVEQWFEDVATEQFIQEMQAEADGSIFDPENNQQPNS
jgi:hypothetical protein